MVESIPNLDPSVVHGDIKNTQNMNNNSALVSHVNYNGNVQNIQNLDEDINKYIYVYGARENNLKNVTIKIPKNKLSVITGVSGSGKSSLAFDTIYAEGQRRYVESLSIYARQFLSTQNKPEFDRIVGISPAISINQKTTAKNPRSTIATASGVHDHLRLLFACIGVPHSPATGKMVNSMTPQQMAESILQLTEGMMIHVIAPVIKNKKGDHSSEMRNIRLMGFQRIKINDIAYEIDQVPTLDRKKQHNISIVIDRIVLSQTIKSRLVTSIEKAVKLGHGVMHIEIVSEKDERVQNGKIMVFSEKMTCAESGMAFDAIEPRMFSFNSPYGTCTHCNGLGKSKQIDHNLMINHNITLSEGAIIPWSKTNYLLTPHDLIYREAILTALGKMHHFNLQTKWPELSQEARSAILHGMNEKIQIQHKYVSKSLEDSSMQINFDGLLKDIDNMKQCTMNGSIAKSEAFFEQFTTMMTCNHCNGNKLRPESLCIKIAGLNIAEVTKMSVEKSIAWIEDLRKSKLTPKELLITDGVLNETLRRLKFLYDVGLKYLPLSRESSTLSGGESQRIRLASQIGSGLTGVLYVLDEPSIGLHQCDNDKLISTLKHLRDMRNTVIVVEHDEETIMAADYVFDIGPGAGRYGGYLTAEGTPNEIMYNENSITGAYLSGRKSINVRDTTRKGSEKSIKVLGAKSHNLKNITVEFPLGKFICVCGVSGGGKSSLVFDTLYATIARKINGSSIVPGEHDCITGIEYIDKVIHIDQSRIGCMPSSNPATYTGAFNAIRDLFAATSTAKKFGYKPGRFSFNAKGGRCEACQGNGETKVEMHFLPDMYIKCDECNGKRYNEQTLEVHYKGKSIADVLDMTIDEATIFFKSIPSVYAKLSAMQSIKLGYMKLGQSALTISGGEAQRIKLSRELSKQSTGQSLYILDEPTTGLHTDDISKLLYVLHALVDKGNTVIVIEHNLDVIKTADHIIDIGPEGGDDGGRVMAIGTPREVSKHKDSVTGKYLQRYFVNKTTNLAA